MIGYLVLDENFKDYLGRDWTPGKQNTASGQGNRYGNDWILAYKSPLVTAFVYPAHEGKLGKLMQVKAIGR
ncbi:hypothetical protein, partial [Escherichia coli]|uniref:hypothetical protein n=1 Tax=Escherichia coli TaxID=562 RepID=UPI003F24144A